MKNWVRAWLNTDTTAREAAVAKGEPAEALTKIVKIDYAAMAQQLIDREDIALSAWMALTEARGVLREGGRLAPEAMKLIITLAGEHGIALQVIDKVPTREA